MSNKKSLKRCAWVRPDNMLYEKYHDQEWGVWVTNEKILFEFLILESAQAGLSWETILKKRAGYRKAFAHFDPNKVARFTQHDINRLTEDSGIVRHRSKIESAVHNAKIFLALQKEFGSFANYLATLVGQRPLDGKRKIFQDVPTTTPEAVALSQDLKQRGFTFFGPTIAYAFLQAIGRVNDHTTNCFRYQEIKK